MNDSFDRSLILLIFFVAISYLNFLSVRLKKRSGWSNVTCNPMNLFANSMFQTREESNREFERCVVKLSTEATTQLFKEQKNEQEEVIKRQSGIEKKYDLLATQVKLYADDISGTIVEFDKKAKDVKNDQKDANNMNKSTTDNLNGYLTTIQGIFQNIGNYF